MKVHASVHLCGVQPARLREFVSLLRLGELNPHVDSVVKPALVKVLEGMNQQVGSACSHPLPAICHRSRSPPRPRTNLAVSIAEPSQPPTPRRQDTEFVVQLVILAGDLSVSYDGFHSQNRHARSGMGNFCSHAMGFALLLTVLDKYRSEDISGISQRLGADHSPPAAPLPPSVAPPLPPSVPHTPPCPSMHLSCYPLPAGPSCPTPPLLLRSAPWTRLPSPPFAEKEGLKRGLLRLIVEFGLPLVDLCTDQCRGAPCDIKLVLSKPEVQKMLKYAPAKMRAWLARQLGSRQPVAGQMSAEEGAPPWAHVVAEMQEAMGAMVAISPDDLATIVHHFDVFHVEVKVIDAFKKFVLAGAVLGRDGEGGVSNGEGRGRGHIFGRSLPTCRICNGRNKDEPGGRRGSQEGCQVGTAQGVGEAQVPG